MPNNKAIVAWLISFGIIFGMKYQDLLLGFFLTLLTSLPLTIGKWYATEAIPARFMDPLNFPNGYFVGWGITPLIIITILCLGLILRYETSKIKSTIALLNTKAKKGIAFLIGWFILSGLANLNSPFPPVSWVHLWYQSGVITISLLTIYILTQKINAKKIIGQHVYQLLLFQTGLGLLQLFKQSTLGLAIESGIMQGPSGGIDQLSLFRPVGTLANPNQFGLSILVLGTCVLMLRPQKKQFTVVVVVGNILLSLSRSLWVGGVILFTQNYREIRTKISWSTLKRHSRLSLVSSIILCCFGLLVTSRLLVSTKSFDQYGGITDRIILIRESLDAIERSPFLGTSVNTNEITMFRNNPTGIMTYFPTAVHNAYLQIAVDTGIPALTVFLIGLVFIFQAKKNHLTQSALVMIAIFYLFQPHIDIVDFSMIGFILGVHLGCNVEQPI